MPRPARIYVEGALCLVSCRAAEGTALFREPRDYDSYLALLAEYRQRYGFKLFAYALLPDEVHLLVEPVNGATVSSFMHALNSRYTKYVIKRRGPTPRLFERFKLTLIEKAPSLLRATGYLHTLPRRRGAATDVSGYGWSSCQSYLAAGTSRPGPRQDGEVAEVLARLNQDRPGWTYALYLESVPEEEWTRMSQEVERPAVGSAEFLTRVEAEKQGHVAGSGLRAQGSGSEHSGSGAHLPPAPSPQPPARRRSPVVTASLAMALVSVVAALLSARSVAFLKHTLKSVAEESGQALMAISGRRPALASFHAPERMEGTAWQVQLKPMVGTETAAIADRLEFDGERMVSASLSEAGFLPGRFRVTPSAHGMTWETVQIGPGGEIVSWRGESSGRSVHGTVTHQRPGGLIETFRFVGMNAEGTREI